MSTDPGERLSREEVERLLRRAREAYIRRGFMVGSPKHTIQDFGELKLISHEDQLNAIDTALKEISADDYKGPHPPRHKSKEPKCKGARMLQFAWNSKCFEGVERMYVKFCLADDRFVLLRIHEDWRPNEYED